MNHPWAPNSSKSRYNFRLSKAVQIILVYMKSQDDAQESVAVCWIHAPTTLSSGSILPSVPRSVWLTSTRSNGSVLNSSWIPELARFCGGWSTVWTIWYLACNATEATDLRLVAAFCSAWRAMFPHYWWCTMCYWIHGIVAVLCSMGEGVSKQGVLCCHLLPYHSKWLNRLHSTT